MVSGGIDIGSRFIKYVLLADNEPVRYYREETGPYPLEACKAFIDRTKPDKLIATGYGRNLLEIYDDIKSITEIKAAAAGAKHVFNKCRTVIDIGGQDTKVIRLDENGRVIDFEMNDRCAAGTGKFMEIMAKTLKVNIEDFDKTPGKENSSLKINSLCTVFAESEVISLIAKGIDRNSIICAIHVSVISKLIPMTKRTGIEEDIVFTGGCAKNAYLGKILEEKLGKNILIFEQPDMLAAFGAALYAKEDYQ